MKYIEKVKSRKFQVWAVWTILAIISLFRSDLPKETIFQCYCLISLVYIGANTAQRFVNTNTVK